MKTIGNFPWAFRLLIFVIFPLVLSSLSGPASGLPAGETWLKGYERTISGETISYHSPFPGPSPALLARATDGTMSVEWETEPVPPGFHGGGAVFLWMAGLSTGEAVRSFELSIEGIPRLSFQTCVDSSRKDWSVSGQQGVRLSFQTTMVDQFDDLFGFMRLEVPEALLNPGRPLRLGVTGEKAGSRDWFMVFEKRLRNEITARGEQALVRKDGRLSQMVRVEITHIAPPAEAVVILGKSIPFAAELETGYNGFEFEVPAVDKEQELEIEVSVPDFPRRSVAVPVKPVTKREIWLLPHSHVDIGYSDPQPVVEKKHWGYYEQAVRLAEETSAFPEGSRFKWNIEQMWAVETYLRQAGESERERFVDAVRNGWIGLQATLAGVLTGLCHPEELIHLTEAARTIAEITRVPVDSAMVTDIPSQSWSLIPALASAGVRYFSSGPNYMPSLPDGGDRIGRALSSWGDRPFYWISPSGTERVLFWMAGKGYSWFHGLHMGGIAKAPRERIFDYLNNLESRGYPYSMVQVRYTIGGDNGPPDQDLAPFVRKWNEEYESPRMVIATASEMFREFERRHGPCLPSVKGDFTPHWEDGAASTALETALNRRSAERLVQAGILWSVLDPDGYPGDEFDEAWRQVLLFSEHTWGAAESVSDPDSENSRSQWEYKKLFADGADRLSKELLESARRSGKPDRQDNRRLIVDVFNTCSWRRTDIARIDGGTARPGDLVKGPDGKPVPSQILVNGGLAFEAADIPPLGAKRFIVERGPVTAIGTAHLVGTTLENGRISAEIDSVSGAVRSLKWNSSKAIELVDTGRYPGLNHYLYVPGRNPVEVVPATNVRIRPGELGSLVSSLIVTSDAPGARRLDREYRILSGQDRLEIVNILDKKSVRDKESVHLAFPFDVPGRTIRVDVGWGLVRPGLDQIEGANQDYFSVEKSIDLSNERYAVTWTSLDVPLAEIGELTDESPNTSGTRSWREKIAPSGILFSYVMNNYWHTNFKADQAGPVVLAYAVQPHRGVETAEAKRISIEASQPLVSLPAARNNPVPSFPVEIRPETFIVTSLAPAEDRKGWIMRLYNADANPGELLLKSKSGKGGSIFLSGLDGRIGERIAGPLRVPGFGIVTLYVSR